MSTERDAFTITLRLHARRDAIENLEGYPGSNHPDDPPQFGWEMILDELALHLRYKANDWLDEEVPALDAAAYTHDLNRDERMTERLTWCDLHAVRNDPLPAPRAWAHDGAQELAVDPTIRPGGPYWLEFTTAPALEWLAARSSSRRLAERLADAMMEEVERDG
jgi:hypothetical protein